MNNHSLQAKIPALILAIVLLTANVSCNKEDLVSPVETNSSPATCFALLDYQDTLHIAYAMRTDLYDYNNIVFQFVEGGRLDLYSLNHLHLGSNDFSDSADLVSYDAFEENHHGVVAMIATSLFPYGQPISRGKITLSHSGDQYAVNILGATESGIGFRSQFFGQVHDLTAPSSQGWLNFDEGEISFRLGVMVQEGNLRTYHFIGSNPYAECVIRSSIDIAGKKLPISTDPEAIENGSAVGLTASMPYDFQATAVSGNIECSSYGNVYTLVITATTDQGNATGHFTGPIYTSQN